MMWGWTYSGILSLALGLIATALVAWLVYWMQSRDHTALKGVVDRIDGAVREISEKLAEDEQHLIEQDSDSVQGDPTTADASAPAGIDDYIRELKGRGVKLDYSKLRWSKKVRADGDGRGNLGWFVDDGGSRRFFIHRGRKTVVRPAVPRHLLRKWEEVTGRNPREVELDYQTGRGSGSHAWFVRTYAGDTWRIGTGKGSVTVTPLDE
ncbi:hypothetical protein [Rhodococcoides fascians]|uniref:hypothetical protein n=1 Tax=Rhodococcoides fascians TaxID=1828 RepID=UPI00050C6197|nr:hypothetical protein [Rhodococcus fascians]